MNRALVAYACLMTSVALWLALRGDAGAQDAPPTTSMNGDVDCDGRVNLTDAVLILRWVFSDGPAPCELEPRITLPVPITPDFECIERCSQVICEDLCERVGDNSCVVRWVRPEDRFIAEGEIVRDLELDLEWRAAPERGLFTWCETLAVARDAGDRWRVPTALELLSIMDFRAAQLSEPFPPFLGQETFLHSSTHTGSWVYALGSGYWTNELAQLGCPTEDGVFRVLPNVRGGVLLVREAQP